MTIVVYVTLPDGERREFQADLANGLSYEEIDGQCVEMAEDRFGGEAVMECWTVLEEI
jgi:hypothetical protein